VLIIVSTMSMLCFFVSPLLDDTESIRSDLVSAMPCSCLQVVRDLERAAITAAQSGGVQKTRGGYLLNMFLETLKRPITPVAKRIITVGSVA
jgi:hypothetical protein